MGVKKALCMTIACVFSFFLLTACSSSGGDDGTSGSTSGSSSSLNCSAVNKVYDWTEEETVRITTTVEGEEVTEEVTVKKNVTVDIGSTCGFQVVVIYDQTFPEDGVCNYKMNGIFTSRNARTYYGSGSFSSGCISGTFDITLISDGESITYSIH